ncbi:hypothetical protein EDD86DRAFT_210955 [Gorgonomyces haynaldii]|nr:hypothetical protein EDD86DRAFT_210955 [Gorgonomyces haynaldii]
MAQSGMLAMCTSCSGCLKYKQSLTSNRCAQCGCLAAQHRKIDPAIMPGYYNKGNRDVPSLHLSWIWSIFANPLDILHVKEVESVTLNEARQQFSHGQKGVFALSLAAFFSPLPTGHPWIVLLVYSYACLTFLSGAFVAYRMHGFSVHLSKRVLGSVLFSLNCILGLTYILNALGCAPKLPQTAHIPLEPMRYMAWLVVLPTMIQVAFDLTSNREENKWLSRLTLFSITSLFIGDVIQNSYIFYFVLPCLFFIGFKVYKLFQDAINDKQRSMIDPKSLLLTKLFLFAGFGMLMLGWCTLFETSGCPRRCIWTCD